jgi:hypothetical protein
MELKELMDVEYVGWYVDYTEGNKIVIRSDYTIDPLAEIYITLEKENHVSVTYFSSKGGGILFEESNLSPKEISIKALSAADDLFDYIINISNTKVFNGLEIYYFDEYNMNYEEAKLTINKLKNEWRLPDLFELIQIYSNKEIIGLDINYGKTLTSDLDEETEDEEFEYQFVWTINFNNGLQQSTPASNSYNIIFVKNI